jgi:hypothetical protein
MVKGPDANGPGGVVSYNEAYEDEGRWAEQMAADPNWFEVDRKGVLVGSVPPPPSDSTDSTESTESTESTDATTESE